jgi:hypothetical protein
MKEDIAKYTYFLNLKNRISKLKNPESLRILTADLIDEQLCVLKYPSLPWPAQPLQNAARDSIFLGGDILPFLELIKKGNLNRKLFYMAEEDKQYILNTNEYDLD